MDKNAIKKFAIQSRVELIKAVRQKAFEYKIEEQSDNDDSNVTAGGRLLTDAEQKQRASLISQIRQKGYEQVMEEVAYTWFNRFIALRYMEVNNFLPSRVRVFSDENDEFNPEILKEAMTIELDGIDKEKIYDFIEKQDNENLYKYLIITQCNALGECLPGMFEKIEDYTELLFPNNLLKPGNVLERMVDDIPTEDWEDIEIIGWIYQYYISEKHEEVVDPLHGKTVEKDDIPAATQLFTTKWVVQYIVDNSLGRYWIERHPESKLADHLEFFVKSKSDDIKYIDEKISPEEIRVFDPCCGSAHFLVYAFEVLLYIYLECGYSERDAAKSIVENNLYGLDIDNRAGQLAYFAVMMKARKCNRKILNGETAPNVTAIQESNSINPDYLSLFGDLESKAHELLDNMKDAKDLGSIIRVKMTVEELTELKNKAEEIENNFYDNFFDKARQSGIATEFIPLIEQAIILAQKYEVVATNPPYLNKFDKTLKKFVNDNYSEYKADLFSVFIYRNFGFCEKDGYSGFMSPFVWMFIKSYEALRQYVIHNKSFVSLIQMEYSAFEEATVPVCSFILKNGKETYKGLYFKLSDFKGGMDVQKQKVLEALADENCKYFFETSEDNFSKIPGSPVAYWVSKKFLEAFVKGTMLGNLADSKQGIATADNNRFLREWFEVDINKTNFSAQSHEDAKQSNKKWFPYNKGGEFRKWYGNNDYLVNWENDGLEIKNFFDNKGKLRSRPQNLNYMFRQSVSWSLVSSGSAAFRYKSSGHLFDIGGMSFFSKNNLYYLLGLVNTKYSMEVLKIIAPTINYQCGDIACIPVIKSSEVNGLVETLVKENIEISKADWDSYETSWDFKKNPLV